MTTFRCFLGLLCLVGVLYGLEKPAGTAEVKAVPADPVDEYIAGEMKKQHIPGLSVAVVKAGKVIKQRGFGLASVEMGVPASERTVYPLLQITSTFTALGVMILVEEGKISADDNLGKVLPNVPDVWKEITIKQLLSHSSGLPDCRGDTFFIESLERLATLPMLGKPGQRISYNEADDALLGLVIEQISGKPLDEFLRARLFQPLGMQSTSLNFNGKRVVPGRIAFYKVAAKDALEANGPAAFPDYLRPSSGLDTTTADLVKWAAIFSGSKVLRQSSLDAMWTPTGSDKVLQRGWECRYGLGWEIRQHTSHPRHKRVGQLGSTSSAFGHFVDENLTVFVLTNLMNCDPDSLVDGIAAFYIPDLAEPQK